MISVNGAGGKNCTMASRPTGITNSGRNRSNSAFSHRLHSEISARSGTRSPPAGSGPGKHRHTAAM